MMVAPVDSSIVAGLSEAEAIARLERDGYNKLPSSQARSLLVIAWDIIQDPIFLVNEQKI